MIALQVAIVALVLVVAWAVAIWNRLVTLRNRYANAFAQIDVQLKRRYDLIPNLVETAKGYLAHERETLQAVIAARGAALDSLRAAAAAPGTAAAMQGLAGAESALGAALGRVFALAERYPELKADVQMRRLAEELTSTENRVAFARQHYNDAATEYNTARQVFPASLLAGAFGHGTPAALLSYEPGIAAAPVLGLAT
ncbi:MAG TPA: LemA family protein [Planctomycetota bacterium]|nr:LemA family protein [Planctomycetota bacterium]